MTKRYTDFETMHVPLFRKLINMPYLPVKTMGIFELNLQQIDQRKSDLEKYLRKIAKRSDVVNSKEFRDFMDVTYLGNARVDPLSSMLMLR